MHKLTVTVCMLYKSTSNLFLVKTNIMLSFMHANKITRAGIYLYRSKRSEMIQCLLQADRVVKKILAMLLTSFCLIDVDHVANDVEVHIADCGAFAAKRRTRVFGMGGLMRLVLNRHQCGAEIGLAHMTETSKLLERNRRVELQVRADRGQQRLLAHLTQEPFQLQVERILMMVAKIPEVWCCRHNELRAGVLEKIVEDAVIAMRHALELIRVFIVQQLPHLLVHTLSGAKRHRNGSQSENFVVLIHDLVVGKRSCALLRGACEVRGGV